MADHTLPAQPVVTARSRFDRRIPSISLDRPV